MHDKQHRFINFGNGTVQIGASDIRQMGKRPSLFITRGNTGHKVASFASVEAAYEFTNAMSELLGLDKSDD